MCDCEREWLLGSMCALRLVQGAPPTAWDSRDRLQYACDPREGHVQHKSLALIVRLLCFNPIGGGRGPPRTIKLIISYSEWVFPSCGSNFACASWDLYLYMSANKLPLRNRKSLALPSIKLTEKRGKKRSQDYCKRHIIDDYGYVKWNDDLNTFFWSF